MLPLLTFASGIVAGIVGVRLLKSAKVPENLRAAGTSAASGLGSVGEKARQGMGQAQAGLRKAAVSGLSAVERSSASLRAKIEETPPAPEAGPAEPSLRDTLAATTSVTPEGVAPGRRAKRGTTVHKTRAHEEEAVAATPRRPRGRRKPPAGGGEGP